MATISISRRRTNEKCARRTSSALIRVTIETHKRLLELKRRTRRSMAEIVEKAVSAVRVR
jgi:predicted DNA-binding protein